MKYILLGIISLSLFSCSSSQVTYLVGNNYVGLCNIFVYNKDINKNRSIVLENGLGRINSKIMSLSFEVKSLEDKQLLDVIQVGEEKKIDSIKRCVFGLGMETSSSSKCINGDITVVTFFVGNKMEFSEWLMKHEYSWDYFNKRGIDWCQYYLGVK